MRSATQPKPSTLGSPAFPSTSFSHGSWVFGFELIANCVLQIADQTRIRLSAKLAALFQIRGRLRILLEKKIRRRAVVVIRCLAGIQFDGLIIVGQCFDLVAKV